MDLRLRPPILRPASAYPAAVTERILLVEDDELLAGSVRDYLEGHSYTVEVEHRGDRAVDRIRTGDFAPSGWGGDRWRP